MKSTLGFLLSTLLATVTFAYGDTCFNKNKPMDFNESQIINWRDFMPAKFKDRAYVRGVVVGLLEDRQNHIHLEIDFDGDLAGTEDRIELIYNSRFGTLESFAPGDQIIACGDFISDPYSPLKAVIHWLHQAPPKKSKQTHEDGYLIINGRVYGLSS